MEVHEGARIAPVRSFFDYYTRGALDACIGLMDRDVRFVPLAGSGHVFDGRSAVRRFFDDARRDGVTLEPRAHRFLDCGPDCVVAAGTLRELRSGQLRERTVRSEERRVGKEWGTRVAPYQ